jgi:zinc finger protein
MNTIQCPKCKEGLMEISKTIYDLPDKDKMLILKLECDNCHYMIKDIIPLTTQTEPGISQLKITDERDLKSKVYRSPTAKIEIPELELEANPGPAAPFYFTNIEGILNRFETAVISYKKSLEADNLDTKEIDIILENIKKAYDGKFSFTLRIIDQTGGSYIVPEDKSKYSFIKLHS